MPLGYRRRRRYRRRRYGRVTKRRYGRSIFRRRRSPYSANRTHCIKRLSATFALQGNAAYNPYLSATYFTLNSVPEYAELPALFDQYKISMVQMRFKLRCDPAQQTPAVYPKLYYFIDHTDAAVPGSLDVLRACAGTQIRTLEHTKPVIVTFRPKSQLAIYRSALTTGYTAQSAWIDSNQYDVPHYGLKWGIDFHVDENQYVDCETRYWVKLKNPR